MANAEKASSQLMLQLQTEVLEERRKLQAKEELLANSQARWKQREHALLGELSTLREKRTEYDGRIALREGEVVRLTKAKEVLGLQFTPVESTIRDMVESSILLGLYTPDLSASL